MKKLLVSALFLSVSCFSIAQAEMLKLDELNGLLAYCPATKDQANFDKTIQIFKFGEQQQADRSIKVSVLVRAVKCDQNQMWVVDENPTSGNIYFDYKLFSLDYSSKPISEMNLTEFEQTGQQTLTLTVDQADLANLNKGATELFIRATKRYGSETGYVRFGSAFLNLINK